MNYWKIEVRVQLMLSMNANIEVASAVVWICFTYQLLLILPSLIIRSETIACYVVADSLDTMLLSVGFSLNMGCGWEMESSSSFSSANSFLLEPLLWVLAVAPARGGKRPCLDPFIAFWAWFFLSFCILLTSFWCSLKSILWSFTEMSPCDSKRRLANLKFSCSIYWISLLRTTKFRLFGLNETNCDTV